MQLTTATNVQNVGRFQMANTALKAGDSNPDRQSQGETYIPYQQGDQFNFQRPAEYAEAEMSRNGLYNVAEHLLNMDTRVYTSVIPTFFFSALFHALVNLNIFVTLAFAVVFYFTWYILSFFNFSRAWRNAMLASHTPRQRTHQLPASF